LLLVVFGFIAFFWSKLMAVVTEEGKAMDVRRARQLMQRRSRAGDHRIVLDDLP
jgi:hypothetical protein